jgi:hypothetical protein
MKTNLYTKSLFIAAISGAAFLFAGCDIDQTEEGELPEVEVKGGNLPEYDVDVADVDVDTEEETIKVPKLKVAVEEETIEVPDIDVNMPE